MRCKSLVIALLLVSLAAIPPVWAGNVVIKGSTTVLPIALVLGMNLVVIVYRSRLRRRF